MNAPISSLALMLGLTAACGSPEADLASPYASAPEVNRALDERALRTESGRLVDVQAAAILGGDPPVPGKEEAAGHTQDTVSTGPQGPEVEAPVLEAGFDQMHTAWTALLGAHVADGRVDYGAWKKNAEHRAALTAYLATLVEVTPGELEDWSAEARLAFWINVYNASVVNLIVENYPLKSIEDLTTKQRKVWDKPVVALGSHLEERPDGLSLNDVEHEIVRKRFADARIHAALNCAAESCPPLLNEAFREEDLDEQLEARMRAFVGDGNRNAFNAKKKRLELSRLFEWFAADFERDAESVPAYVQRYAPAEFSSWAAKPKKVEYLDYSWKLNDVER